MRKGGRAWVNVCRVGSWLIVVGSIATFLP